jgi:hypothetical protein
VGSALDGKTSYLGIVEKAVRGGLRAKMRAAKVIAEYLRTYVKEWKRLATSSMQSGQRLIRRALCWADLLQGAHRVRQALLMDSDNRVPVFHERPQLTK